VRQLGAFISSQCYPLALGFFEFSYTLYRLKVESLVYIFAADCMGLSCFTCPWWAPKGSPWFCCRVR